MNEKDLESAIVTLHEDNNFDKIRFEQSAISDKPYYDMRKDVVVRLSQKKQAERAIQRFEEDQDELNRVGVYKELADLFYKAEKAKIIYKDNDLSRKIHGVMQDMQLKAASSGIPAQPQLIYFIAKEVYNTRAKNLIEGKPVVDVKGEVKLIEQTYKSYLKNGKK